MNSQWLNHSSGPCGNGWSGVPALVPPSCRAQILPPWPKQLERLGARLGARQGARQGVRQGARQGARLWRHPPTPPQHGPCCCHRFPFLKRKKEDASLFRSLRFSSNSGDWRGNVSGVRREERGGIYCVSSSGQHRKKASDLDMWLTGQLAVPNMFFFSNLFCVLN